MNQLIDDFIKKLKENIKRHKTHLVDLKEDINETEESIKLMLNALEKLEKTGFMEDQEDLR